MNILSLKEIAYETFPFLSLPLFHLIYPPAKLDIRFKHQLVSVHCFLNGNGRHSLLMADLIMEKLFHQSDFTWGSNNLIKANESRKNYINAVRKADNYDIQPLITFANS